MVKVTGLHGLGDHNFEAEYVNIDYPETLALYIIGSSIGVKSSRKLRFSVEANGWRRWAEKFANAKTRCVARPIRVLGINYLEDIFGYQVTLYMLCPLRFKQLCLERLKKSGGNYRHNPNTGNVKYSIRATSNAKESAQFDR